MVGGHLLGKGYVIAVRVRVIQIFAGTDNILVSESRFTRARARAVARMTLTYVTITFHSSINLINFICSVVYW